jgi:Cu(I)/Ag(I) efflux system membrane fusion protein
MNKNILILFLMTFIFSCGKKEQPVTRENHTEETEGLLLSDQQIQLGHIETDSITEHPLGDELLLTGVLMPNQNKLTSVSSRVMGRIEKLYFKNIGEEIKEGQPIYDIYSEDLNLATKELKLAIEKKKLLNAEGIDMDRIIQSARNKLSLYGLSQKQVQYIENSDNFSNIVTIISPASGVITSTDVREGDYIMEGGSIYHMADLSSLWAEVQVYSDDLSKISENMVATVYNPSITGGKIEGKISFMNPELNPSSKINVVRIELSNQEGDLKPGMQINVSVLLNKQIVLALPTDAIILDGKGASVWVQTGHNQFKNVMVETGTETNEYTEIKSGLKQGDIIVTSGAYLLSSEYLFKNGTNPMEGHDMTKM